MMVSTHDAFLDLLKGTQILSADELKRAADLVDEHDDSKSAARKLVSAGLITRWQAGQLLKGGKPTLALGKYVLLDRLPWGSGHAVFLAKHPTMERKVALNVLDKSSSTRKEAVKSFLADARAIAALDHRHLIHVYDIDEADNRYFLVMEHVEGRNLHDAVKASG
jgi:serine/threonine-protein kinase